MIHFRWLSLFCVSIVAVGVLSGCTAAPIYQPNVFKERKFNSGYVAETAKSSSDIFDFVGKIYIKHERIGEFDLIKNVHNPNYEPRVNYDNIWDTYIYETYCRSKLGLLFKLYVSPGQYYICEKDGNIESAIAYYKGFIYNGRRDNDQEWYSLRTVTPNYFKNILSSNENEYYYSNTDKSVRLDSHPSGRPYSYRLIFNIKNIGSTPLKIALNDAKVIVDGKEYLIDLKYKSSVIKNPDETFNSHEILTLNGRKEFASDSVILILGETKYVLTKRMIYEDRVPFAVNVDNNNIL